MVEVRAPSGDPPVELDVCRRCHLIWFDGGERAQLNAVSLPDKTPELSRKARVVVALHQVDELRRRSDAEDPEHARPEEWWKWIPGVFALPVERDASPPARWPMFAWSLALALAFLAIYFTGDFASLAERYGVVPSDPFRAGGLNFVTYALIPAGLFHGLVNAYFLAIFGDNVEDEVGPRRMGILLLLVALAAAALHAFAHPASAVPLVGPQGAVTGLLLFYTLRYPHARISFLMRYRHHMDWVAIPAWLFFIVWVSLHVVVAGTDLDGWGAASSAFYIGAVGSALCLWYAWRDV